jgi:hypothetical protein
MEYFANEANFAFDSDIQGLVVSNFFDIQLILYEVQVIDRIDSPYHMFHVFLLNVLRYISFVQYFL